MASTEGEASSSDSARSGASVADPGAPAAGDPPGPQSMPARDSAPEPAQPSDGKRTGRPSVPPSTAVGAAAAVRPGRPARRAGTRSATGGRRVALAVGVIVGLGLVTGAGAWELWRQITILRETTGALEARYVELEQRMRSLGSRMPAEAEWRRLNAQVEVQGAAQDRFAVRTEVDALSAVLGRRLRDVEERLTARTLLPGPGAEAVAADRLMAEFSRAAKVNRTRLEALTEGFATGVSVRRIRDATRSGDPFDGPLATLQRLEVHDEEARTALQVLAPFAGVGITPKVILGRQFGAVEQAVRRMLRRQSTTGLDRWLDRLTGLVQIRRTRQPAGNTPEEVLTRAGMLARGGELQAAWEESGKLPDTDAEELVAWRSEAEATLAVLGALQVLERYVDRQVAELLRKEESERGPGTG